jgi:hypothetical protein
MFYRSRENVRPPAKPYPSCCHPPSYLTGGAVAFLLGAQRYTCPDRGENHKPNYNRHNVFRWRRYYGRRFERHTEVRGEKR